MNIRSPGRGLSNKILKIYDTVLQEFFPESKNFYGELTNYLCFAEEFNTGGRKGISIELAKLLSTIHEFPKKEETPYIYIYISFFFVFGPPETKTCHRFEVSSEKLLDKSGKLTWPRDSPGIRLILNSKWSILDVPRLSFAFRTRTRKTSRFEIVSLRNETYL